MPTRPLSSTEKQHPLAWENAVVLASTSFDEQIDSVFIKQNSVGRVLELFEDYEWLGEYRALTWEDFEKLATETKRPDWPKAALARLAEYGLEHRHIKVWIGEHLSLSPWLLGFETIITEQDAN